MTPEQAELLRQGAAFVAIYLHDDSEGIEVLLNDPAMRRCGPDAFIYLTLAAEEAWRQFTRVGPDAIWGQMSAPDPVFPAELVNRDVAVRVAKALRDGDSFTVASVANQLDLAGALLSSLDLALASLALVSDATGVPSDTWCQRFAEAAAAGAGVDEV